MKLITTTDPAELRMEVGSVPVKTYSIDEALAFFPDNEGKNRFGFPLRAAIDAGHFVPFGKDPVNGHRLSYLDILAVHCLKSLFGLGRTWADFHHRTAYEGVFNNVELGARPIQHYLDMCDLKAYFLVMQTRTRIQVFPASSLERKLNDYLTVPLVHNQSPIYALVNVGYWAERLYSMGCHDDKAAERLNRE